MTSRAHLSIYMHENDLWRELEPFTGVRSLVAQLEEQAKICWDHWKGPFMTTTNSGSPCLHWPRSGTDESKTGELISGIRDRVLHAKSMKKNKAA